MKLIIIVALLAFASTASAMDLPEMVDYVTEDLTDFLNDVHNLIQCVSSLLTVIDAQLDQIVQSLLTVDLDGILEKIIELVPSIYEAAEGACESLVEDLWTVVTAVLGLVVKLLEGEGTLLAQSLASLVEVLLGVASNSTALTASNKLGSSFGVAAM